MNANDPAAESLDQDFGIARIIAEIGNNQGIVVVLAIDCRQCVGTIRPEQVLRQLVGRDDAQLLSSIWITATDHCGGAVAAERDIMRDDRLIEWPGFDVAGIVWPAAEPS